MLSLSLSNISNSSRKQITQLNQAAASFDGTNDFIDASLLGPNINKTSGSISHWVKITTSANNEILFSCSDGTSGNDKIQTVFMTNTSSGQFQGVYKAGGTAFKAVYNYPAVDIVNAGWFHLAMTYVITEENALTIKLYFNGALQNTFTGTAETITEGVAFDRVILGKNANADNSYLAGLMDECMYFSGVLSDDQILGIYNSRGRANINRLIFFNQDAPTQATCKLWLRFGDGGIGQAKDQTTGIVDMSNPTLESELIVNGDFSTSGSITTSSHTLGWSRGGTGDTGSSIVSNQLVLHRPVGEDHDHARIYASDGSSSRNIKPSDHQGKTYLLELDIASNTGSGNLQIFTGGAYVNLPDSSVGKKAFYFSSDNTQLFVMKMNTEGATLNIDNVSLREVQGHPAFVSGALINQDDNPTA